MAFDISLGESPSPIATSRDFEGFCAEHGEQIARSLNLACNESALAQASTQQALAKASQRWKHLRDHPNPVGWVIAAGLDHADKSERTSSPMALNEATGGYVRGLELEPAVEALPLYQRAALVTGYYLGWSDDLTAAGFETPVAALTTRRTRAISFLTHHLRSTEAETIALVQDHLRTSDEAHRPQAVDASAVRARGRRRTVRNRSGALLLAALVIVAGAALIQADAPEVVLETPEPVDGPQTSSSWFDPVSDGRGAFVALNTSGSSKFVESNDGSEWFSAATWNSRSVDMRAQVTAFSRTGGRYLAVLEAVGVFRDFLPPRVATSNDLTDWSVRQLDIEAPVTVEGLRRGYSVVAAAASGELVLVAVEPTDELDHRAFDITAEDVCGEQITTDQRRYYLCDGETSIDVSLSAHSPSTTGFFLGADGESFRQVVLPPDTSARSLIGFGGGFAIVDANQGQVWVSPTGIDWVRATTSPSPNRFVLLEGDQRGALVIEPDAAGWTSRVIAPTGVGVSGDIPLDVDPSGVWSQPSLASGPAGWALFVTTSRPWERSGGASGWAVATPSWIVSQLPDTDTVTAQSIPDGTTLRLAMDGPWVRTEADGAIVLQNPQDDSILVEVTQQQIDQARPTSLDESRVKAQVFFSPDGASWTSVWSSTEDAWSGSVAVGDDEILLSGTQLTGTPIAIEIDP